MKATVSAALLLTAIGCLDVDSASDPSIVIRKPSPEKSADVPKTAPTPKDKPRVLKPQPFVPLTWKGKTVGKFSMTERNGKTITNKHVLGKPAIYAFIFTHCAGPCTDISRSMWDMQNWLKIAKIDARLVTITVDPKRDTPKRLREYAKGFGAKKEWWFLTGDEDKTYKLIRDSFGQPVKQIVGKDRKPGWEVFHSSAIMLVDAKGKVIDEYNGKNDLSMVTLRSRLTKWKRTGSFDKDKKPAKPPNTKRKP